MNNEQGNDAGTASDFVSDRFYEAKRECESAMRQAIFDCLDHEGSARESITSILSMTIHIPFQLFTEAMVEAMLNVHVNKPGEAKGLMADAMNRNDGGVRVQVEHAEELRRIVIEAQHFIRLENLLEFTGDHIRDDVDRLANRIRESIIERNSD